MISSEQNEAEGYFVPPKALFSVLIPSTSNLKGILNENEQTL
jgi:hypothetical protein